MTMDHDDYVLSEPIMLSRSDAMVSPYDPIATSPLAAQDATQGKRKSEDNLIDMIPNKSPRHHASSTPSSPDSSCHDSDDNHSVSTTCTKKPGRKPMTDESPMEDEEDFKTKRRLQNRQAQRHFRERKERYVKELEGKLKQVQDAYMFTTQQVMQENQQLKAMIYRLEMENVTLKGMHLQHGPLAGKSPEEWAASLKQHQDKFALTDALSTSLASSSSSSTSSWLTAAAAAAASVPTPSMQIHHQVAPVAQLPSLLPNHSHHHQDLAMDASAAARDALARASFSSTSSPGAAGTAPTHSMAPAHAQQGQTSSNNKNSSNKHLQYTFSISTPATLRSRHKQQQQQQQKSASASSNGSSPRLNGKKSSAVSPVELVRLYAHDDQHMTPFSASVPQDDATKTNTTAASPAASSEATSNVSVATSSAVQTPTMECHEFCERLNEQVCHPLDQLLTEPLFDVSGSLTIPLDFMDQEHPLLLGDNYPMLDDTDKKSSYLPCSQIWQRLRSHHRFDDFENENLLALVKSLAKCSLNGPVLLERDIQLILAKMDNGPTAI
ncbi:hypothetical protein BC940DRAFT_332902 [Gongronella butleri]|nr:hypothetical protein BC940DRAFT_332902 [Gongronella butleri]